MQVSDMRNLMRHERHDTAYIYIYIYLMYHQLCIFVHVYVIYVYIYIDICIYSNTFSTWRLMINAPPALYEGVIVNQITF